MKLSFKIIENNADIQESIAKALLPKSRQIMAKAIRSIKESLPIIVNKYVINSPEYASLIGGILKYELGIPNASNKIAGLLDIWSKNIDFKYDPPKIIRSQVRSSFSASMIKINFEDVLFTDFAVVRDNIRGYDLPWLQWLLLEGNSTIIEDYQIVFGANRASRTGNAIMKKNTSKFWKVPSLFSGTIADNWITRSIRDAEPEIQQLLNKVLL
jgi:hypothetical protein